VIAAPYGDAYRSPPIDPPLTPSQRAWLAALAHGQWCDCPDVASGLARAGIHGTPREFGDLFERGFAEVKAPKNGAASRVRSTLKGAAAIHWTNPIHVPAIACEEPETAATPRTREPTRKCGICERADALPDRFVCGRCATLRPGAGSPHPRTCGFCEKLLGAGRATVLPWDPAKCACAPCFRRIRRRSSR
jgi:hypothetical protein